MKPDHDWKTIPSVVTADEADAFDIERAYREKCAESQAVFETFMQDWRDWRQFTTDRDFGDEA